MAFVALSKGLFALIDARDRRAVARFKWQVKIRPRGTAYAVTTQRLDAWNKRFISLHRFIWELHDGIATPIVDHENGWGLDCRLSNLRAARRDQNAWNTAVHKDSASGIKGVTFDKTKRRWRARLTHNGRRIEIGCFRSKRTAKAAYRVEAVRLYGVFARVA